MLNLISLGLNKNSITAEALEAIKSSDTIYLENYTVDFPYSIKDLEKSFNILAGGFDNNLSDEVAKGGTRAKGTALGGHNKTAIKITSLSREKTEDESIIQEAKEKNISLLIYGDALSATTHTQLLLAAKKANIKTKIFHNASILTAVAETGLQLYKFGKTASLPSWKEHKSKPKSFTEIIKQNQSIKAHTLLLIDIDLSSKDTLEQLEESISQKDFGNPELLENVKHETGKVALKGWVGKRAKRVGQLDNTTLQGGSSASAELGEGNRISNKIIIISQAGTQNSKIYYNTIDKLKQQTIKQPFAIIIPTELHFLEEETLNTLKS